jgi:hypothetical protein
VSLTKQHPPAALEIIVVVVVLVRVDQRRPPSTPSVVVVVLVRVNQSRLPSTLKISRSRVTASSRVWHTLLRFGRDVRPRHLTSTIAVVVVFVFVVVVVVTVTATVTGGFSCLSLGGYCVRRRRRRRRRIPSLV